MSYKTAKGRIDSDGRYIYICGACKGANNPRCNYCYGLNMDAMLEAFAVARGQQYYSLLKAILSVVGKDICDAARQITGDKGGISPANLIYLCIRFRFPKNRVKPLAEWLEENRVLRTGCYWRMKERGFQPTKAWDEVAANHPLLRNGHDEK